MCGCVSACCNPGNVEIVTEFFIQVVDKQYFRDPIKGFVDKALWDKGMIEIDETKLRRRVTVDWFAEHH